MDGRKQDFSMEGARLHAKLGTHRRAVDRAVAKVKAALESTPGTWAVSVSGGKDSTAMLSIALAAGWQGPVFHFRYHQDYDVESVGMAREISAFHKLEIVEIEVAGEFDAFDRCGHFFPYPRTEDEKAAANWWERTHKKQINEFLRTSGWAGVFIGLRIDESKVRSLTLRKKGWLYDTQDRPVRTCCPLSDWSGRDVWARIASQNLPYLARYDDVEDRVRQRSEECWLGINLWRFGMASEMKTRDPAMWNSLLARFPDLVREL